LPVVEGTIVFKGTRDGHGNYFGTAYTFKKGCDAAPYPVAGKDTGGVIVLTGAAPHRDPHSCAIIGDTQYGKNSRLAFEFEPD
jgi:hypothetical protein